VINRIAIKNFQSLKNVNLEFGKLTVIVGDSNSGKSAFIRAFKAVVSNCRGNAFVTRGQSKSFITVEKDHARITLEKGEGSGAYKITGSPEQIFTKIGTGVPSEVTAALRISPSDGALLTFAGQHDMPYLLNDTGSSVARVLGDLTNVSIIFEAVREGNRRRNSQSSTVKTMQGTLDSLGEKLKDFKTLPDRKSAIDRASEILTEVKKLEIKIERLRSTLFKLENLQISIRVENEIIPDGSLIQESYDKLFSFRSLVKLIATTKLSIRNMDVALVDTAVEIDSLGRDLRQILIESGECPTCHQKIN